MSPSKPYPVTDFIRLTFRIATLEAERDKFKLSATKLAMEAISAEAERDELRLKVEDAEFWARQQGTTIDWEHRHRMRLRLEASEAARETSDF